MNIQNQLITGKPWFALKRVQDRRWTTLLMSFALALSIASSPCHAQRTVAVATVTPKDSPFGMALDAFGTSLSAQTGTRFRVLHDAQSKLGGEADLVRLLREGKLDMALVSTGTMGSVVPDMGVFDLPFLFYSYAHARKTLDGPIGTALLQKLADKELVGLAWGENGFRHLSNNHHAIAFPEDIKGLRVRTMENKVHIAMFESLGATAKPLPFTKLTEALRTGDVQAQENPISIFLSTKIYEQQHYLSLTQHVYSPAIFLVSASFWKSLSSEEQSAFRFAAAKGSKAQRERVTQDEIFAVAQLQKMGVNVTTAVEHQAFRSALRVNYAKFAPDVDPSLWKTIQATR